MQSKLILEEICKYKNDALARHHQTFFKCFEGGYGDKNDTFCGIYSKDMKLIAKRYFRDITFFELEKLLENSLHEARTIALFMLVLKFDKADMSLKKEIVDFYLKHTNRINNWDLVDLSVYKILGRYTFEIDDFEILYTLSNSQNLWEQRMSVVANWYLIHKGEFNVIVKLCEKFLNHKHDLMHKACGWMLREMGKFSDEGCSELIKFLDKNHKLMPRTMLRYSLEKMDKEIKKLYM
ncbi:MAG: DNA alkylation repair protein [Campylobacteraceae bacterium]